MSRRVVAKPPADSKALIVEAGLRILRKKGDRALSVRAATTAVGLSEAAAYQLTAFTRGRDGKPLDVRRSFLAAVAEHGFGEMREVLATVQATGRERIRALSVAYMDYAKRNPALYRVMFSPELGERTDYQDLARVIADIFEIFHVAIADTKSPHVTKRTNALVLLLHGFAHQLVNGWIMADRDADVAANARAFVDFLVPPRPDSALRAAPIAES